MGLPAPARLPLFTPPAVIGEGFLAALLERPIHGQPAELPGFVLALLGESGRCALMPSDEHASQGVLYEGMSDDDFRRLDAYQGVGEGLYERTHAEVLVGGTRRLHAFIYVPSKKLHARLGR